MNNFACMRYDRVHRERDCYNRAELRRFPGGRVLYVPRFDDDGRLAWVTFAEVMSRMFRFDRESLPDLNIFSSASPSTIVVRLDGTGFGSLSIAQLMFRSVYTSYSHRGIAISAHCCGATTITMLQASSRRRSQRR